MCGRFVSSSPPDELIGYFGAEPPETLLEPSYNVAPTDDVYAVRARGGRRHLDVVRWGLIPSWADDPKIGSRMINARAETIASKPAFRRAFERRRCLVPADGFYEWEKVPGQRAKRPWFVHRPDDEPVVFAGIWERWSPKGDDDAEPTTSCCILTTAPNAELSRIHDRMPVLLPPSAWDRWLDPASDADELRELLVPAPDGLLALRPVSTEVNDVRNAGPQLIAPVEPVADEVEA